MERLRQGLVQAPALPDTSADQGSNCQPSSQSKESLLRLQTIQQPKKIPQLRTPQPIRLIEVI